MPDEFSKRNNITDRERFIEKISDITSQLAIIKINQKTLEDSLAQMSHTFAGLEDYLTSVADELRKNIERNQLKLHEIERATAISATEQEHLSDYNKTHQGTITDMTNKISNLSHNYTDIKHEHRHVINKLSDIEKLLAERAAVAEKLFTDLSTRTESLTKAIQDINIKYQKVEASARTIKIILSFLGGVAGAIGTAFAVINFFTKNAK